MPGIVGLGKAVEIAMAELENNKKKETELRDYLIGRVMDEIPYTQMCIRDRLKAFFLENRVLFPGILFFVAIDDDRDLFRISLLKLRSDRLRDLLSGVGVHIIETALDRVCEFLDDLRMFFEIALFCAVGGVGNVACLLYTSGRILRN